MLSYFKNLIFFLKKNQNQNQNQNLNNNFKDIKIISNNEILNKNFLRKDRIFI
tara:strand:+ start:187 stop:345 length:159 start_codon:yes stop_codon:yes gene_type:complete